MLLKRLIEFYRERLSGRGALRHVRCTFENTESCGAYGQRVVEGRSTTSALLLIVGRLRRCREFGLYLDREGWAWSRSFETKLPEDVDAALARAEETPETRGAVLRAFARVAIEEGNAARLGKCRQAIADLGRPPGQLLVRSATGFKRQELIRAIQIGLRTLPLIGLIAFLIPSAWPLWLAMTSLLLTSVAYRYVKRVRRIDSLLAAARFRKRKAAVPAALLADQVGENP